MLPRRSTFIPTNTRCWWWATDRRSSRDWMTLRWDRCTTSISRFRARKAMQAAEGRRNNSGQGIEQGKAGQAKEVHAKAGSGDYGGGERHTVEVASAQGTA